MARKAKTTSASSPFWKGENEGDSISGKFIRFEKTQKSPVAMRLLATDGRERIVGFGVVLLDLFSDVRKKMKHGDAVSITYVERIKRTKVYAATWNKKTLERHGFNAEPITGAALDTAWAAGEKNAVRGNKRDRD